jgi:Glycosyltransferase family 87
MNPFTWYRFQAHLLRKPQIGLLLALIAAASMWCYAAFVLIPHQRSEAARTGTPRGNLSDLYPRWLGARELLLHGRDPYSNHVTREIQDGYYGRPLDPHRANDPKDQQGFAYPVYVVFLLAPTIKLPFSVVQEAFRWLLVLLTIISVHLWMRALQMQKPLSWKVTWILLALGSFPAVQGIKLQQLTLLVCAFLAGCMAAIASGHLVLAGVLLGLATIKPQLAAIFAAWLLLWTIANWRQRQWLAWSFLITMVLLVGGGELFLPGWIGRFRGAANAYWQYTGGGKSALDLILPSFAGKILSAILVGALAAWAWRMRPAVAQTPEFRWTLAIVCAVTLVVIPTYAPYNQLLLLPPLMMAWEAAPRIAGMGLAARLLLLLAGLSVLWPWISAVLLCLGRFAVGSDAVQRAWAVPLYTSLYIPLTVLGVTWMGAVEALRRSRQPC